MNVASLAGDLPGRTGVARRAPANERRIVAAVCAGSTIAPSRCAEQTRDRRRRRGRDAWPSAPTSRGLDRESTGRRSAAASISLSTPPRQAPRASAPRAVRVEPLPASIDERRGRSGARGRHRCRCPASGRTAFDRGGVRRERPLAPLRGDRSASLSPQRCGKSFTLTEARRRAAFWRISSPECARVSCAARGYLSHGGAMGAAALLFARRYLCRLQRESPPSS